MPFPIAVLVTLAWRNLWRNYRRTLIMLAAITVGVWSMIFMTALLRGMVDDMVRTATNTLLGHVQVHHELYLDDPNIANSMPPPNERMLHALDSDAVLAWATRVRLPIVIASERETRAVTLVGINPEREASLSFIQGSVMKGQTLTKVDADGIVIGARLAERLHTSVGKRVVIMGQDPNNHIVDRGVRVIGIYRTEPTATEEHFAFMSLMQTQHFLQLGDRISELEVLGRDYRDTSAVVSALEHALLPQQQLKSWDQLNAYVGSMLSVMDGFIVIWMLVVFVTLSFGLVNTLAMAIFERVREIGLMLALGMRPSAILIQVIIESVLLLSLGLVLGNTLAWLSIVSLQDGIDISAVGEGLEMAGMGSVLTPSLNIEDMLLATVVVVCLGVLASLYPAWKASRQDPITALRNT